MFTEGLLQGLPLGGVFTPLGGVPRYRHFYGRKRRTMTIVGIPGTGTSTEGDTGRALVKTSPLRVLSEHLQDLAPTWVGPAGRASPLVTMALSWGIPGTGTSTEGNAGSL